MSSQIVDNATELSESAHGGSVPGACITDHEQPLLVLFVFLGLALGGLLRQVNRKTKLPYTPMLIVFGIIIGCYRDSLGKHNFSLKQNMKMGIKANKDILN